MYQQRENLDVIFRRTTPEIVLNSIRKKRSFFSKSDKLHTDSNHYPEQVYDHYALLNLSNYSPTEVQMRAEALQDQIRDGVFALLADYAEQVLYDNGSHISCRLDQILNWHSMYLRLGQDLFTTSWLAWKNRNSVQDKMGEHRFTWPAILKTDDKMLNALLAEGLAENHFHLHGSTQAFSLSWVCMMNHPSGLHAYFSSNSDFNINLNYNISSGTLDNVMDWERRIMYAAMIRALLFERCLGMLNAEDVWDKFRRFDKVLPASEIKSHTEMLRVIYGVKFKQINQKYKCLDYANCRRFYKVDQDENNRVLAGERSFLYQCFRNIYRNQFTKTESSLFYLYLLIKHNFRGELIQLNGRCGFQNFADYQDRKNVLFEKYDEYNTEALRLSVCAGIEENHLVSLETRIMPRSHTAEIKRYIDGLDHRIEFSQAEKGAGSKNQQVEYLKNGRPVKSELPYFYVVHFAKKPYTRKEYKDHAALLQPRNAPTRKKVKRQAKALERYMHHYDLINQRVWGIDACSMEIGCRPETFASEFRYLKARSMENMPAGWHQAGGTDHQAIGITYHVGEDFLDIADGLRALDEAVTFLCLEKGDRLGHALALGIDPKKYYQAKRGRIYLRKQDYLDNLVWLLYRTLELGVPIEENYRAMIADKAMELFSELYSGIGKAAYAGNPLELYYRSWKLRGDHPDLYLSGDYKPEKNLTEADYDNYKIAGGLQRYQASADGLGVIRKNKKIAGIYYAYHFDRKTKERGYQVASFKADAWYIRLMKQMQCALQTEIFKKGICIECNPTSNVLIGTFKAYSEHPVLRFNDYYLKQDSKQPKLAVSINTDDLGVFDTSLCNEYALMLHAVCRSRHEEGNYNDAAVYGYLNYLRLNGIRMAFCRKNG